MAEAHAPARSAKAAARQAPAAPAPACAKTEASAPLAVAGNQQLLRAFGVQAKLTISQPDDPDEREADRVASDAVSGTSIARKCASCAATDDERIGLKPAGSAAPAAAAVSPSLAAPAAGQPLSKSIRARVEPLLGADLSRVRVHSDAAARGTAAQLNAKAFTHRDHIWVGPGQSAEDLALMAHEATHVVQQRAAPSAAPAVQRSPEDVRRILADQDSAAIVALSEADITAASSAQRAGMVRVLTDLAWTREPHELATMRLIEAGGAAVPVLDALHDIRYLDRVLDSVDREDLHERLQGLVDTYRSEHPAAEEPGDPDLDAAIGSGDPDEIMRITDFSRASDRQRVAALQILLGLGWSNAAEESRMLDILESAGSGLRGVMTQLKALGLKEALFDHIDDDPNKARLTALLQPLLDPELAADLLVFNQSWLSSLWAGLSGGFTIGMDWLGRQFEHGIVQGVLNILAMMFRPVIHPIDNLSDLLGQAEIVLQTFDLGSLEWWTRLVTLLRDLAGTIGVWLLTISAVLGVVALALAGLALVFSETVIGGIGFGAMAAAVGGWAGTVFGWATVAGLIFLGLAAVRLVLDAVSAGGATTQRQQQRATERLAEDTALGAIAAAVWLIMRGLRVAMEGIRGGTSDPTAIENGGIRNADGSVRAGDGAVSEGSGQLNSGTRSVNRGNVVDLEQARAMRQAPATEPMPRGPRVPMFDPEGNPLKIEPWIEPEPEVPVSEPITEPAAEPGAGRAPQTRGNVLPTPGLQPRAEPREEEEEDNNPCGRRNPPPTQVTFTPASGPRGGEVYAAPLSSRAGNTHGSPPDIPSLWPSLWDCIVAAGERWRWVHAHLLHGETSGAGARNLHGPGNEKANIILSDKTLNGGMSRRVEQPALQLVYDDRCTLWYYVRVNHFSGPGARPYFAESVFMDYGYYYPRTGPGPSLIGGGVTIPRNPDRDPPDCHDPSAGGH